MITIEGLNLFSNNQGYIVALSPVNSQNEGDTCEGEHVWTEIGKRPVITITTNMMSNKEYSKLLEILYRNRKYEITYPIPFSSGYGKQYFRLTSDISTVYKNLYHGKIAPTTINLSAIEAKIVPI